MTIQVQDKIKYNGQITDFIPVPYLPEDDPRIVYLTNENGARYSYCWRGYVATWELKNKQLFLVKISNTSAQYKITTNDPIFADWYTGKIKIPNSKSVIPWGGGAEMRMHEEEIHVTIKNGIVVKTEHIDFKNEISNLGLINKKRYLAMHELNVKEVREIISQMNK